MTPPKDADSSQQKYLSPEFHFIRRKIAQGDSASDEKISVSQFVRRGAALVDFPDYNRLKKKGFLKSPLEAGDNTLFSEDGNTLYASLSGYPVIRIIEQSNQLDLYLVSVTPLVKISFNKMEARLLLHPPLPEAPSLKTENLSELIGEEGIIYGVDQEAVAKAMAIIDSDNAFFDEILFARGLYPGEGTDASLHFELEIGPLAGHRLDDGSIDFRDRRIMVGIREGETIATKIPAIPGEVGYNVLGERIEPRVGNDIRIKVAGDAVFLAEENRVIATRDGALSIVNNDTIKVSAKITINGDVNYVTGNIESENNTTINGSVLPGFKVHVGGDLQIGGAISSATITCGGNVVIKGGIAGQSSCITCEGDVDINFIERATVKSRGIVVIRNQCYYSTIEALSDIRCHPKCTIMGGSAIAGGSLTVTNVGAENCDPALLAAGVDPERLLLYRELKEKLIGKQEEIIQTLQMLGRGARPKKIQKMEEEADELKVKILRINLIPGTELFSRVGKGKNREEMDDIDPMYMSGIDIENIRIEVQGTLYAGTRILVGNRSMVLPQNVNKRQYRLSKNLKRILATPL